MMKSAILTAILTLIAATAFAQSEEDQSDVGRLEAASERAIANVQAFAISRVPELADTLTPFAWDDEMRAVGACFLGVLRQSGGDRSVATYLAEMEEFASAPFISMDQATQPASALTNDITMEIAGDCRAIDVTMRLMQATGLLDVFADPAVMARLTAP